MSLDDTLAKIRATILELIDELDQEIVERDSSCAGDGKCTDPQCSRHCSVDWSDDN